MTAPIGCLDERILRALQMADMQLSAWENGYAFDTHGPSREAQRLVTEALAALSASRQEGWISVDERLPEIGEAALVYTPPQPEDWPDTVRIGIDHISPDYEYWNDHAESYEHWCCVGKPEGSVGPKEKAPYTHWMPIPTPPAPQQSQEAQGDRHG
jgi:hypothetical protein